MSFPAGSQGGGERAEVRLRRHPAARAAHRLRRALEWHGITSEVHEGRGIALVSVCVDLVAWTDGSCYFWWSGTVSGSTGRRTYNYSPAGDPVTAARRVAGRYMELRHGRPMRSPVTGVPATDAPAAPVPALPPVVPRQSSAAETAAAAEPPVVPRQSSAAETAAAAEPPVVPAQMSTAGGHLVASAPVPPPEVR
ncbi:hypothetical protein [Sphaerisporangium fuscum]|uniref:hypothetical protein n=1 Tax=Sphaerisporangium fuscum TaxID=2835868 RepID=UPI001BDC437A|nr:hypothetical protein [Sphaerisporangium fuscum]